MPDGGRIELTSDELQRVVQGTTQAAESLATSAGPLDRMIPGDAFGTLGAPIAAAGNLVGGELGLALTRLSQLSQAVADGVGSTDVEFERIDDEAARAFRGIEVEK